MAKATQTNQPKYERSVLVVDDDCDDLAMAGQAFHALSDDRWEVHLATDASEGLKELHHGKIQLVVLAVNSPVVDVGLLLGSYGPAQGNFKKVVLASPATEESRAASLAAGADLFLEKPISPEGLKSVFDQLCDLLDWKSAPGVKGVLHGVPLADLVQMECVGGNSSIIELFNEQPLGRIYIEQGLIVHAVCGDKSGERAFNTLFTLTGGTFELLEYEIPSERTINRTWEYLLGEALRLREELNQRAEAGKTGATGAEDAAGGPYGEATEMLICSPEGEELYSWQCANAAERIKLLQAIAERAEKLIPTLQLGRLDRVEVQMSDGRAILQPRTDRMIFVRVGNPAKA